MFAALFLALRPQQWLKNLLVFAPLIFAHLAGSVPAWQAATLTFAFFCALASGGYLVNDLLDRTADRAHPRKKLRPIASGRLPVRVAAVAAGLLLGGSLALAAFWEPKIAGYLVTYLALQISYSVWLKHVVLLDLLAISSGFVLRVLAGAAAVGVTASGWLLAVTLLAALLLAAGKRWQEVAAAGGTHTRRVLDSYSLPFLQLLVPTLASMLGLAYLIYILEIAPQLLPTGVVVTYGLLRYLFLLVSRAGETDGPTELLLGDRPLLAAAAAYVALTIYLLI